MDSRGRGGGRKEEGAEGREGAARGKERGDRERGEGRSEEVENDKPKPNDLQYPSQNHKLKLGWHLVVLGYIDFVQQGPYLTVSGAGLTQGGGKSADHRITVKRKK